MSTSLVNLKGEQRIDNVIVGCECDEPEGKVYRSVRLLLFTPANLAKFWQAAKQYRTIFRYEIGGDFRRFIDNFVKEGPDGRLMVTGIFYVVDDFEGIFYMTDIQPGVDASVHYTFFNGRHKGRVELVREMLKYGFRTFGFRRLTAEIPLYASPETHNFVEHWVKFKKEGRKRKAAELGGEFYDVNVYGILREEILEGED